MEGRVFDWLVITFPGLTRLMTRVVLALPSRALRVRLMSYLLRVSYGSLARGTFAQVSNVMLAPEIEWDLPEGLLDVSDRRLSGRDAVLRWYGEFSAAWSQRTAPVKIEEVERAVYRVHAVTRVRSASTGLEAELRDVDLIRFRRGQVVSWHEEWDESAGATWRGLAAETESPPGRAGSLG